MCGIVGIFDTRGSRDVDPELLKKMNESQHLRGPDDGGIYLEPGLGMGHRRLSVIDVASGHQPIFNEDDSVALVYNGELYNYLTLMEELQGLGHQFRTVSDSEVIVHAWEQWGEDCVRHFRGMFAFAIWDRNQKTFFLARDRIGIKPMHYAINSQGFLLFGSELKAILADPTMPRDLNPHAIEDYFAYGYVPDPRTIFKHAFKLMPGHTLTIRVGESLSVPKPYWDMNFAPGARGSEAEIEEELLRRLRETVECHLMSEVPLGAFLSGGVDSSAVVAMMADIDTNPVETCSIAFDDPAFDESTYANQVAKQFNTKHFSETVDANDYGLVGMLARLYDEPYADSSAMPTYRVCKLARQRVTVALSGDGGDENFAGYRRYRFAMAEHAVRKRLPHALRKPIFGFLGKVYPKADWAPRMFRAKTTFEALARNLVEGYFHGVAVMPDRIRNRLFSAQFKSELQGYRAIEVMRAHARNAPTEEPLSLLQYLDFKTYLPGDILTKVDRASMAHSLEVRVPLLDHELVEWIAGLSPDLKLHGQEGKYIFKKALEKILPHDILYRSKMGFSIPMAAWFRGPLRERVREALLGPTLANTGIFNREFLQEIVDGHESGRSDYSRYIWSLLMFESFMTQVLGLGNSISLAKAA